MSPVAALVMLSVVEAAAIGLWVYTTARRVLGLGAGRPIFA